MRPRIDCAAHGLVAPAWELLAGCVGPPLDGAPLEERAHAGNDLPVLLGPERRPPFFSARSLAGPDILRPTNTNLMQDLETERFFKPVMINGMHAAGDGAIKTFPLRGIKDSPPYMHDGRLLTLDDTVEFFNLILGTKRTGNEKQDLVAFLRAL
jgi:hypothetical protein